MQDIPQSILESINEHTKDGFVIFYTDKNGQPSYMPMTKSLNTLGGLLTYAKGVGMAWESNMVSNLMKHFQDGENV
jgi:hypothetical protein